MRQKPCGCLTLATLFLLGATEVRAAEENLTILLHDYVGIDDATLRAVENETTQVFRHASIEIGWKHCYSPFQPSLAECPDIGSTTPALRLVPHFQFVAGVRPDTMGYSTGNMMTVSFEEAEKVARSSASPVSQLLGLIIAHELGHLFLGRNHSSGGIMRARWDLNDFALARQGALVFLPRQAADLRKELHVRIETRIKPPG